MTTPEIIELAKLAGPSALSFCAFLTGLLSWLRGRDNTQKLIVVVEKTDVAVEAAGNAAHKADDAAAGMLIAVDKVDALSAEVTVTKQHINGRMTELIAAITSEQRMKGIEEGIRQGIAQERKRHADAADNHAAGRVEAEEKKKGKK